MCGVLVWHWLVHCVGVSVNKPTNSRQTRGGEEEGPQQLQCKVELCKFSHLHRMYFKVCSADRTRSKWPSLEKFTRLVAGSAL